MEESNSQRLKKSKKFAFENSQFTRQYNISLSGTINNCSEVQTKLFTSVIRPAISHQLGGRTVGLRNKKSAMEQLTAISMDKKSCS